MKAGSFLYLLVVFTIFQQCLASESGTMSYVPQASAETQASAVEDLISRIIPDKSTNFHVKIDRNLSGTDLDAFKITKIRNDILITGTSGVAAATGFNYYLKHFCKCHVSWDANQLNLPEELPNANVTIELNDKFRYYQNVCTTSYSFVWWNWQQWEKHIDWMVLNSFNLVLAFNGQEAIWERVYKKFNLTQQEIDEHLTGPAFLAWLRMGNIRGWGGPLTPAWHSKQIALQKQVLNRMRSLGIIPILPAFAGHIPRAFSRLYPNAKMTKLNTWNDFNDTYCCPYFLEPTEPLFRQLGAAFMREQIAEFGTNHVYNCDSFNENKPSSTDLGYIGNVTRTIYQTMTDVDPQAVWILQNWLFVHDFLFWTNDRAKALLTAVPKGKLIVLDLQSEQFPQYNRFQNYFGQPYIWCMLHNFGGTLGMFGSASIINEQPIIARNEPNSTMVGTGLTPEGINQNYVVYELMAENAYRKVSANLDDWFEEYSVRRYGVDEENAKKAWRILCKSVYSFKGLNRIRGKYAITNSPSLKLNIWSWYNASDLYDAWTSLLDASERLGTNPGFLHDLVDVTRQALQVTADSYYQAIVAAYKKQDVEAFRSKSSRFLEIFEDLESILITSGDFLLGRWIQAARKAASNAQEADQFEFNARNQISLWGPRGEIMNYANKQWSGVVSHFFAPRWQVFLNYLQGILINGQKYNQTLIKERMFREVEEPFTFDRTVFPTEPRGNSVVVAKALHKKWLSDGFVLTKQ